MISSRCRFPSSLFLKRNSQLIEPLGISCKRYCSNTPSTQVPTPWFDSVLQSVQFESFSPTLLVSIIENSPSLPTLDKATLCITGNPEIWPLAEVSEAILSALPRATPKNCGLLLDAAYVVAGRSKTVFTTPAAADIILDAAINNSSRNDAVAYDAIWLLHEMLRRNNVERAPCFTTQKILTLFMKLTPHDSDIDRSCALHQSCIILLLLLQGNEEPAFKLFGTKEVREWLTRIPQSIADAGSVLKKLDELEAKYEKKPIQEEKKCEEPNTISASNSIENQNIRQAIQSSNDALKDVSRQLDILSARVNSANAKDGFIREDQVVSFLTDPINIFSPNAIRKLLTNSKSPELILYAMQQIRSEILNNTSQSSFANVETAAAILTAMLHARSLDSCEMIFHVAKIIAEWCHPSRDTFSAPGAIDIIFDAAIDNAMSPRCVGAVMGLIGQVTHSSQRRAENVVTPKCLEMFEFLIPRAHNIQTGAKICGCITLLIRQNEAEALRLFGTQQFVDFLQTMNHFMKGCRVWRVLHDTLYRRYENK